MGTNWKCRLRYQVQVVDDCIACDWRSDWKHRLCANISQNSLQVLDGGTEKITFICSHCLPDVPKALEMYQMYAKLDSKSENKFQLMENKLYKGIGQHVECFEAANLAGLEVTCK